MSFVIIEGPNGSGKTSIINHLKEKGVDTLSSPNGTPLARFLRPVARGTEPWVGVDKTIQFLAFSAARYDEYLNRVHNQNHLVVADRWWTSTYVYQCVLEGMSVDFLEHTIHPQEQVDRVIILHAKSNILIDRVTKEREKNPTHGICKWTQDLETVKDLNQIYQYNLPCYLAHRKIDYQLIDTSQKTLDNVIKEVETQLQEVASETNQPYIS